MDEYDDTLIDLHLDDFNFSLDLSEAESEASDYSTAPSARTHSFSDDNRSFDTAENNSLERKSENVSLTSVKSDTPLHAPLATEESTAFSAGSSELLSQATCLSEPLIKLPTDDTYPADDIHSPLTVDVDLNPSEASEGHSLAGPRNNLLKISESDALYDAINSSSEDTESDRLPDAINNPSGITENNSSSSENNQCTSVGERPSILTEVKSSVDDGPSSDDKLDTLSANQENTPSTPFGNLENTLSANQENIPFANQENTPSANQEDTPSANQENTPSANQENTQSASKNNTPSANQENIPFANQENTPSANQENTPSENQKNTPSANQEITPSANQENTPSANQENTPSVNQENTPSANQEDESSSNLEVNLSTNNKGGSSANLHNASANNEESVTAAIESRLSASIEERLSAQIAKSLFASHEESSKARSGEATPVRRRFSDSNLAKSRPLSEVSDIQIESVWFVQGRPLEDFRDLTDETTDENRPLFEEYSPQKVTEQIPEIHIAPEPSSEENLIPSEETADQNPQTTSVEELQQPCEEHNSDMGDNARLEEKLRQFQSQAKEESTGNRRQQQLTALQLSELDKQRRRNLIFDEERFEETFLKCLICREVYNETDKLPKMLHCHHTFCMDCLYQMYRVEGEFRQSLSSVFRGMPMTVKIQCPTCREGVIISEAELRRLPNDHTIMELLSFVNVTGKNDISYCPKHQTQPLNFFCEPCIIPVCCDCTVIDHKESKGHKVVNVDEAMQKYTPILEETLKDIRCEKASLSDKRDAIEGAQRDLDRVQTGITDQIRIVFDAIREAVDERERELHDVAQGEVDRKRVVLGDHLRVISDREADLNVQFNSLHQAKDDKDLSLIFTGHKSARDLLIKKIHIPTNSTQGFSITFQYSSRSDSIVKQQLGNLGDIMFHSS